MFEKAATALRTTAIPLTSKALLLLLVGILNLRARSRPRRHGTIALNIFSWGFSMHSKRLGTLY